MHTLCINNEPLISAEEIDGEIIISEEIIALSDIVSDRVKTRISIKYREIFDTQDYITSASLEMLKENIATITSTLDEWKGLVFSNEGGWVKTDAILVKELQKALFSQSVTIVKEEEN